MVNQVVVKSPEMAAQTETPTLTPFGWQAGVYGFVEYDGVSRGGSHIEQYQAQYGKAWASGRKLFALAHAGKGAGKTMAGAMKMTRYITLWPGCKVMIVAPRFDILYQATLPTLFEVFRIIGLQPTVHYDYIKHEKTIKLWHGGCIWLASAEDPDALVGRTLAAVWLDEAGQMPFRVFEETASRLRQPKCALQMWVTTTPNRVGPDHWIYQLWYPEEFRLRMGEEPNIKVVTKTDGGDQFKAWKGATKDNPHGGQATHDTMVAILGGEDSPLALRDLYGEFVQQEGLVFPTFDRKRHVRAREDWPEEVRRGAPTITVAGVDFGFSNPLAVGVVRYYDGFPYYVMPEEFVAHRADNRQIRDLAVSIQRKWRPNVWVCDEADPARIRDLRYALQDFETQVVATKKRKDGGIEGGIAYFTGVLNLADEDPELGRFIVDPSCRHFIHQIEAYTEAAKKEGQDQPEKPKDHHNDMVHATRYAITWLCRKFPDVGSAAAWQTQIIPYATGGRRG